MPLLDTHMSQGGLQHGAGCVGQTPEQAEHKKGPPSLQSQADAGATGHLARRLAGCWCAISAETALGASISGLGLSAPSRGARAKAESSRSVGRCAPGVPV